MQTQTTDLSAVTSNTHTVPFVLTPCNLDVVHTITNEPHDLGHDAGVSAFHLFYMHCNPQEAESGRLYQHDTTRAFYQDYTIVGGGLGRAPSRQGTSKMNLEISEQKGAGSYAIGTKLQCKYLQSQILLEVSVLLPYIPFPKQHNQHHVRLHPTGFTPRPSSREVDLAMRVAFHLEPAFRTIVPWWETFDQRRVLVAILAQDLVCPELQYCRDVRTHLLPDHHRCCCTTLLGIIHIALYDYSRRNLRSSSRLPLIYDIHNAMEDRADALEATLNVPMTSEIYGVCPPRLGRNGVEGGWKYLPSAVSRTIRAARLT